METPYSPLEKKFLEDVLRPAITVEFSRPTEHELYTTTGYSETLDFSILVRKMRNWYETSGGRDWLSVLNESAKPEKHDGFKRPKKSAFPPIL